VAVLQPELRRRQQGRDAYALSPLATGSSLSGHDAQTRRLLHSQRRSGRSYRCCKTSLQNSNQALTK
jgi:hypothetical protein